MSYLRMKANERKRKLEIKTIRKFKKGKSCEMCRNKKELTVHNHGLSQKYWVILCRDCHDRVDGIVREGDQIKFLRYRYPVCKECYKLRAKVPK